MKPTISLDASQWIAAARQLAETDKRTCVDFINGQALRVASFAIEDTKRADAAKIKVQLGAVGTAVKFSKNKNGTTKVRQGKFTLDYKNVGNTLAARILGKIWDKNGFKPAQAAKLEGKTLAEQVRIFINWRAQRTAFIASGWIPAIKKLASIVYEKPIGITSRKGATQFGAEKGSATPAKFQLASVMTATIANTALKTVSELGGGDPMPAATEGLQKALNRAASDMMQKLAQRRQRDFDKVNAHK